MGQMAKGRQVWQWDIHPLATVKPQLIDKVMGRACSVRVGIAS